MEFLTAIGGKIAECTVEPVGRHVRYVFHYRRNLRRLQSRVADLDAARESLKQKIVEAKRKGRKVETSVTNWLTDMNEFTEVAKDFLKDEHQAKIKCLYGFCPNLMARHHLSRKSILLDDELDWFFFKIDDMQEGLDVLSTCDDEAYDSRTSAVQNVMDEVMDELRNSNTDIIGVYGIGGVGKTTLVKKIYKQATTGERLFDEVVMVLNLKQNPSIERIQKEIAEKLGLNLHEIENPTGRVRHLCDRIKDKKTLVILDDVWETIDLEAVGLPRMPTLKILMTSRSKIVLRGMATQKEFRLDLLDEIELKDIEWTYSKLDMELKSLFILCGVVVGFANSFFILDLWKYSMGLGLLNNVDSLGGTWVALNSLLEQLKDSCLLLDSDDNTRIRMHDLVKKFARGIAYREQHVLSLTYGSALKEWPDKEFMEKCTMINVDRYNFPMLPDILQCQELTLFHLSSSYNDSSREIPCNFFKEMKKTRVLDLTNLSIPSLPLSLQFLISLRTLCLDQCTLGDIALVGQLQNLEILSFLHSKFKQLPKEIGQLIRLRLLDLTGCSQLEVISPNVLSSLKSLEHLRMGNSFNRWEVGRVINTERSNATLEELKHLHQLTAIQIHIPDAHTLPANLFTSKLERFQICIGPAWKWDYVDEPPNTLELKLTASNELDQGLKLLLKKTEDLSLEGMEGVNNSIVYQLEIEDFQQLKHLHIQKSSKFAYMIINGKVIFPNLSSLVVHQCNDLRFILSSYTARSLVQLKHLEITECKTMEEIISTEQYVEEITGNMFPQLQHLKLKGLPNLARFCSASYVEFPTLKRLQLENCAKLETFISDSKENPDTVVKYLLFDEKVGFPKLERLTISDLPKLTKIWGSPLSQHSFCILRDVTVQQCNSLTNIVPDSIARYFQQLQKLTVENCRVEDIVAQEEREMPHQFVLFPELTCLELKSLPQLKRFYERMHALKWRLLKTLELFDCRIVDIFASGFSGPPKTPHLGGRRSQAKQPFVLVEKSSFPNLEYLTLGPMDIWYGPPDPATFYERAVFPGISSRHTDLKTLRLHGMEKLIWQWDENTEPVGPVFPQLEILELNFCGLHNQELSAISFQNITILEVTFCWRLKYLTTCSVARRLVQLKKLKVDECKSMKEILANGVGEDASNPADIVFSRLRRLELSDLISLERFCSRNCTVKVPLLETSGLVVDCCSLKLDISSDRTLEEVDSNMHLNAQESHTRKEEAGATTEASGSLETNQKQPAPNASEGAQDIESEPEAVIQERTINSQSTELAEVMVTNTSKNLQEADWGRQETLDEPLNNLSADGGKQFQFQADSRWHRISKLEAEIRHLKEELRNKEQKLADERLATVDPSGS